MNYMFINFYRGMGLLTAPEHKKFPLEREIADNEEMLEGNEVACEEYNTEPSPPLEKVDKLDDIEERPSKK